jgi:hypothetical protein
MESLGLLFMMEGARPVFPSKAGMMISWNNQSLLYLRKRTGVKCGWGEPSTPLNSINRDIPKPLLAHSAKSYCPHNATSFTRNKLVFTRKSRYEI